MKVQVVQKNWICKSKIQKIWITGRIARIPFATLANENTSGHSGGGGGVMIEARIGRLEDDVKEMKADMKVVRTDLAELKGKVSMLPGYGGIALIVGVIGGVLAIAPRFLPSVTP